MEEMGREVSVSQMAKCCREVIIDVVVEGREVIRHCRGIIVEVLFML